MIRSWTHAVLKKDNGSRVMALKFGLDDKLKQVFQKRMYEMYNRLLDMNGYTPYPQGAVM